MKLPSFLIGFVIGGATIFTLTYYYKSNTEVPKNNQSNKATTWLWPDSLDAMNADAKGHKILFENDKIRILEGTVEPYAFDPMHTHKYASVMFGSSDDTSQFDIVYYRYSYDSARNIYYVKDSIKQHSGGQLTEPNVGDYMKPEGPHSVKNLSNVRIHFFRVELKDDTTK